MTPSRIEPMTFWLAALCLKSVKNGHVVVILTVGGYRMPLIIWAIGDLINMLFSGQVAYIFEFFRTLGMLGTKVN